MKVVLVDFQYDYGDPARGINTLSEIGFRQAIAKLGHTVLPFYYDGLKGDRPKLQSELIEFVSKEKPDLVWFMLHTDEIEPTTIRTISKNFKTLNWFGDDTWRFDDYSKNFAPLLTHVITTDPFAVSKYRAIGVKNVFLSQWAALELAPQPPDGKFEFDVTFVGLANAVRRWFVSELRDRDIKVETFGNGWPSGPVSAERMLEIFRRSRINLNLSNSRTLDLRFLMSSFRNMANAFVSKKVESQIKARNFEIPYAGGFQLTDYVPFIDRYLIPGQEIACYDSLENAASLIRYYLTNEQEREKIRAQSERRARSEHGYSHRHRQIFEWLEKNV